ncbi:formimidoylglutamase [Sphingobacterium sp. Mn56C]|uniref:formimidoylglutamase n=1 Tax=Sphingobacterium sp. Mn56C TaxID=3395261 RepID=UPI003BCBEB50
MNDGYTAGASDYWTGRVDGTAAAYRRWHQVVQCLPLTALQPLPKAVAFLGFVSDEGVRRNQGRVGAAEAPAVLRSVLAGLPVHFNAALQLLDVGDIRCQGTDLESAQQHLAGAVEAIVRSGAFPLLLGGGHEITFPHFLGLKNATRKRIGIINIDAHLDIRQPSDGRPNSGTGFYQISQLLSNEQQPFSYLAIGIQQIANTAALFQYAQQKGVQIIGADAIHPKKVAAIKKSIRDFAATVDYVYLSIDMDAFAAPFAPGVSALAFNGIIPDRSFWRVFKVIINLPNLIAVDIAELNPALDIDNRTARLAADLIFKIVQQR